jgi:hypothetical protein
LQHELVKEQRRLEQLVRRQQEQLTSLQHHLHAPPLPPSTSPNRLANKDLKVDRRELDGPHANATTLEPHLDPRHLNLDPPHASSSFKKNKAGGGSGGGGRGAEEGGEVDSRLEVLGREWLSSVSIAPLVLQHDLKYFQATGQSHVAALPHYPSTLLNF